MKYLPLYLLVAAASLMLFPSGCNKDKTKASEYLIKVDSIHVADTITAGDTLNIEFFGVIGPNGCYSFDRFDADFSGDSLLITAIGIFSGGEVCPEILPLLDGAVLKVGNLIPGDYTIAVNQPDNTKLTENVTVVSSR